MPDRNLGMLAQCMVLILDCKDAILSDGLPLSFVIKKNKSLKEELNAAMEQDDIIFESQNEKKKQEGKSEEHSDSFASTGHSQSNSNQAKINFKFDLSEALAAWKSLSRKAGILPGPSSCKSSHKNIAFNSLCADLLLFSHPLRSQRGSRSQHATMDPLHPGYLSSRVSGSVLNEETWRELKELYGEYKRTEGKRKVRAVYRFSDLINFFSDYVNSVINDGDVFHGGREGIQGAVPESLISLLEAVDLEECRGSLLRVLPHVRTVLDRKLGCSKRRRSGRDRILNSGKDGHGNMGADVNSGFNEVESDIPLSILLHNSLPPPSLVRLLSVYQNIIEECVGSGSISPLCAVATSMGCGTVCVGGVKRRMLTQEPCQILDACIHLTVVAYCDEVSHCHGSDNNRSNSDDCKSIHNHSRDYHNVQEENISCLQNILLSSSSRGYWEEAKMVLKSIAKLNDAIREANGMRKEERELDSRGGVRKGEIGNEDAGEECFESFNPFHCSDIVFAESLRSALRIYEISNIPPSRNRKQASASRPDEMGESKKEQDPWTDVRINNLFPISPIYYAVIKGEYSFLELLLTLFPSESISEDTLLRLLALSSTNDAKIVPEIPLSLVTRLVSRVDPGSIAAILPSGSESINPNYGQDSVSLMVQNMLRNGRSMVTFTSLKRGMPLRDVEWNQDRPREHSQLKEMQTQEQDSKFHDREDDRQRLVGIVPNYDNIDDNGNENENEYDLGEIEPQYKGVLQGLCLVRRHKQRRGEREFLPSSVCASNETPKNTPSVCPNSYLMSQHSRFSSLSPSHYHSQHFTGSIHQSCPESQAKCYSKGAPELSSEYLKNIPRDHKLNCSEVYIAMMDGSRLSLTDFFHDVLNLDRALPAPQLACGVDNSGHTLLHEAACSKDNNLLISLLSEEQSESNLDKELIEIKEVAEIEIDVPALMACGSDMQEKRKRKGLALDSRKAFITNKMGISPLTILIHNGNIELANTLLKQELNFAMSRTESSQYNRITVQPSLSSISMDATAISHQLDVKEIFLDRASAHMQKSTIAYISVRDRHLFQPPMSVSVGTLIR